MKINKSALGGVLAFTIVFFGGRALWHTLSLESSFDLAPNSRLPKWFTVSSRLSRSDFVVEMDYHIGPNGRTATFILRNARTGSKIATVDRTQQGSEPLNLENVKGRMIYPSYEIVTVGKMTEVIEHRKAEPIFYVTDDPSVLSKLGVSK